jgi:plastocyanin
MKRRAIYAALAGHALVGSLGFAQITGKVEILEKGDVKARVVREVVVFVDGVDGEIPDAIRTKRVQIASQNKSFEPRLEAVPVGGAVSFPNLDPIMHNVFSLSTGNKFDLGLYKSGASKDQRFQTPGLVRIYCNIHPQMSAFVMVLPNSYFSWARPDGSFRIDAVPPGVYTVKAWNERAEAEQQVKVGAAGTSGVTFLLDARRFKQKPHLNKFGKPYKREKY